MNAYALPVAQTDASLRSSRSSTSASSNRTPQIVASRTISRSIALRLLTDQVVATPPSIPTNCEVSTMETVSPQRGKSAVTPPAAAPRGRRVYMQRSGARSARRRERRSSARSARQSRIDAACCDSWCVGLMEARALSDSDDERDIPRRGHMSQTDTTAHFPRRHDMHGCGSRMIQQSFR